MKTGIKILLITASILLASGLIIFMITLARVDFDFTKLSTSNNFVKVEKDLLIEQGENLYINIGTNKVKIMPSSDDKAHFTYYDSDYDKYSLTQENGEISLSNNSLPRKWYEYLQINFISQENVIQVFLPSQFNGDITIKATTGNIDIADINDIAAFSVSLDTGRIECRNISAKNVSFAATTGDIIVSELQSSEFVNIHTTTGKIDISNIKSSESISCKSTTGRIIAKDLDSSDAALKASTGNIKFEKLNAKNITVSATTGNVSGTIWGEQNNFAVTSFTSTGNNNLPSSWGSGDNTLNVSTTTGNIHVTFIK